RRAPAGRSLGDRDPRHRSGSARWATGRRTTTALTIPRQEPNRDADEPAARERERLLFAGQRKQEQDERDDGGNEVARERADGDAQGEPSARVRERAVVEDGLRHSRRDEPDGSGRELALEREARDDALVHEPREADAREEDERHVGAHAVVDLV